MNLNRDAKEQYRLQISTVTTAGVPITLASWEASFDRGATFVAATIVTWDSQSWAGWLIAGPDANPSGAVAVIPRSLTPIVRVTDSPEIVARNAPPVYLT